MKKNEIKQAAMSLFAKKGYHDTSIQDIADSLHINKATLYMHFKGKSDLYSEIMDDVISIFVTELKRILDNVIDRPLESVLKSIFFTFVNNLSYNQILIWKRTLLMSTSEFDQEVQESSRLLIEKLNTELNEIYSEAILAKNPDVSDDELSGFLVSYRLFIGSFVGDWMLVNSTNGNSVDILTMAEAMWQRFWNGNKIDN